MAITDEPEKLAKLLLSVKPYAAGIERPLSPWTCSMYIRQLVDERGKDKTGLPIGPDMIDQFLSLERIPADKRRSIIWNETSGIGVVFSSALKIARLKDDDDKRKIMDAYLLQQFTKTESDNIVVLRNKRSDLSIEECVEQVTNFRPKYVENTAVVLSIVESKNKLKELAQTQKLHLRDIIKDVFEKKLETAIIAVSIKEDTDTVLITMNENTYNKFEQFCNEKKLADNEIMSNFLGD